MCGIFAAIKPKETFSREDFRSFCASCDVIAHRGPDDQTCIGYLQQHGEWTENDNHFQVFFGHRRLAILGLEEASNQPFSRDHITLIFNGEVFNYLEIKKEHLSAYEFTTGSDTEVILRAYQKFGTDCFRLFNGMWSIVILDKQKNKIVVCRDRFSVKPLYYYTQGGAWFFASEIKQIKRLKPYPFSPNAETVKAFLNQALLDHTPDTFYEGIRRFPAMHVMEMDLENGSVQTKPYWHFSEASELDFSNPEETFRNLLIDSLRLRLRSDVPVGTLLSGGLDSSAITTLIKEHLNDKIVSFSVVSDVKKYSEEPFIDILVREKNILNHKLRFHHSLALQNINEVLDVQDEPYGSLAVVAQNLLFSKIKEETGIKVLLSGQGADEILLGYNKFYFFYLKHLLRRRNFPELIKTATGSFFRRTTLWELNLKEAKRYLPGRTNQGRGYFISPFNDVPIWEFENLNQRQILDIEKYSIPALAHYEDRNSMDASIEVRLPFLDFRLVDYMVNLPPSYKLKNGWTKYILRKTVSELPDAIRWRRDKKGFVTPEEQWMKGDLGEYIISEMRGKSRLEEMGILDTKAFVKAVQDFRNGAAWLSHGDLFRVYITEKWLRAR